MSFKIKYQPSSTQKFSIICAMDEKMGIGKGNSGIPWSIPEDRQFFHETTINNIVIMGRKTWETIPNGHLPNRLNIIISKNAHQYDDDIIHERVSQLIQMKTENIDYNWFQHDFESALHYAYMMNNQRNNKRKIYVIGGQSIFEKAITHPDCEDLLLTFVKGDYNCDVFFPKFNWDYIDYNDKTNHQEIPKVTFGKTATIHRFTRKCYFERSFIKYIPNEE